MSGSIVTTSKSASVSSSPHKGTADLRMLAQVEKWMAMIREINREAQTAVNFPAVN